MRTKEEKELEEAARNEVQCRKDALTGYVFVAFQLVWSGVCGGVAAYYAATDRIGFVIVWTVLMVAAWVSMSSTLRSALSLSSIADSWKERQK